MLRPCQRTKKAVEHAGDSDNNCRWCIWNAPTPQSIRKWIGTVKSEEESRSFRGRSEYWEESWWLEGTCCHLDTSESLSENPARSKARHDWVGKVIHWEMCRKFQFDPTNKWYMHNPHKLLWNFNIQTDHLIPARRPDLIIINKKKENRQNCRLCCPGGSQNKSEGKWKER